MATKTEDTRCGMVAILGAPNAGKSTLTNALVGGKVTIVTPKVQTTRVRVRGVLTEGQAQLIFIDTPGIFGAKKKFEQGMVDEAWAGAADADVTLLLIDAKAGVTEEVQGIIEALGKRSKKTVLALNKVDLVQKPYLLKLATALSAMMDFATVFMISAEKSDGLKELKRYLAKEVPTGPWLYPEDQLTDASMRDIAAEITREKLFLRLRQELPYSLAVEAESWEEPSPYPSPAGGRGKRALRAGEGVVKIRQAILVEREGQKKIVIGDKGATLKAVGISARKDIEEMLGRKVMLELFVKVEEKWKGR